MKLPQALVTFVAMGSLAVSLRAQQVWDWGLDYVAGSVPPVEIGPEGAWAYGYDANVGDDLTAPFEFTPFPFYGAHVWGAGDYYFDAPNPALMGRQGNGLIVHTAPNRNQPVILRWRANRDMNVVITGRAYKFSFDENNGRTQEFYIRKNDGAPLAFGTVSDATLDNGLPIPFYAAAEIVALDVIDIYFVRSPDKVQGFIGMEVQIVEIQAGSPVITGQPAPQEVAPGNPATLAVTVTGNDPLNYQWQHNGNDIPGANQASYTIPSAQVSDSGIYTVHIDNALGGIDSLPAILEVNPAASSTRHDLQDDFQLSSNPTARGWQYSVSLGDGGTRVRPLTVNWNSQDFGPGQTGWEGPAGRPHAGWARRVNNGNDTPTYDDPVGAILTHGPTSAFWKAPPGEPNGFATLSGGIYNIRQFGRSGVWRLYKNTTLLTEGPIDDSSGTSAAPKSFATGSGGASVLEGIPYQAGDIFRLEVLEDDFTGVSFSIETTTTSPDPLIVTQPQGSIVVPGSQITLAVTATGTPPLTYQWRRNGQDLNGATAATLILDNVVESGDYQVLVRNGLGATKLSVVAAVLVSERPTGEPRDLVADFEPNKTPATGIGPDGSWSYGYDANTSDAFLAPFDFVPMPLYSPHIIGGADYHITAPNPASLAPRGPGIYIHTSDQPNQQPIVMRWLARRPMRVNISGKAYKYEVESNGRTQDFFVRKNSGPLLASGTVSDDTTLGAGTEIPFSAENVTVLSGDFIDLFVARHPGSVQGFLGVEMTITEQVADLSLDFDLTANPTAAGWQYSQSRANGGGPVGPLTANWNQPDFGAGQPGWAGISPGPHAGWAKRIDNGNDTPTFDDPVDTILTHGPTSVKWTAPAADPGGLVAIRGSFYNIRHLARSGTWRLWKNDTQLLSEGSIDDVSGSSASPKRLLSGVGGAAALVNIPYVGGDVFRLEILEEDFVGLSYSINTYVPEVELPLITQQPANATVLLSATAVFTVAATGPGPLGYQWQFNDADIPGANSAQLTIPHANLNNAGGYRVIVSNGSGSVNSDVATLSVDTGFPGPARQQDPGADGLLVLEAEHFDRHTPAGGSFWTLTTTPAGFSGSGAMEATPNAGRNVNIDTTISPRLDFKVNFARAGNYSVWVRGVADSTPGASLNDSVNVGLDFSLPASSDRITGFPDGAGYVWTAATVDTAPATFTVPAPGLHVIHVWMREDGFILDKLLITSNPNLTPTGAGPAESGYGTQTWEAYADFSVNTNPNGVWEYRINEGNNGLMAFTSAATGAGGPGWQNPTAPVGNVFSGPWAVFDAAHQNGQLGLISHGPAELRWVAPGNHSLSVQGWLMQPNWELARRMRLRVEKNGAELAVVDTTPDFTVYDLPPLTFPVAQGDAVSFKLKGDGAGGNGVSTFVGYDFKLTGGLAGTTLHITRADGTVTIDWTGPGVLQRSDALGAVWSDVPGAASPYSIVADDRLFFRLRP